VPACENKTVLVTGATSGLGLATARALVQEDATVIITGRCPDRCAAAAEDVSAAGWIVGDFTDLSQVVALAEEFKRRYGRLDVLMNNAGAVFQSRRLTPDGLEMTFLVNHLAPFLLTMRLLETLVASAPSRIVNVSSVAHEVGRLKFDDLEFTKGYGPYRAYARTKLANVMFTYELARRLAGTGVTANAIHPGMVRTDIGAKGGRLTGLGWTLIQLLGRSQRVEPEEAAHALVHLACAPELERVSGEYFIGESIAQSTEASRDPEACARLWTVSEELLRRVSALDTATG
jgi:NAD(P)-dependent dehydrogenase (short-subunit alcohol dehydrogenase family)